MIQCVSYLRCSGESQVVGDTWNRQQEKIQSYASQNSITIVSEFRDEGVTGKMELEGRAGLSECLQYVREKGITLVIVEDSTRLARDMIVAEVLIREFQKMKVRVISASGGIDLTAGDDSNPTAKLIRQILAAVAEFDRCVITLKLKGARDRIKSEGRRPGQKNYSPDPRINCNSEGRKPYGQRPGEQEVLARMKSMRAAGAHYYVIADTLNAEGVPCRMAHKGKVWKANTIQKILTRKTKVGTK